MDNIRIVGGVPLKGRVRVSGAKNAVLPIMCATLLAPGKHTLRNVPNLRDVRTTLSLLKNLGASAEFVDGTIEAEINSKVGFQAPYELVKQMRASILVLGPLVARWGYAEVSLPGGCAIGARPIDQHLAGLQLMGAEITLEHGYVRARAPKNGLRGAEIPLSIPTVTGTENLLCAATLAKGETIISNAAREPEIVDLAKALSAMGAKIEGAGTSEIRIQGVQALNGMNHSVMSDRIEAGTLMVAAAATQGDVFVEGAVFSDLEAVCSLLRFTGAEVKPSPDGIHVSSNSVSKPFEVITAPHPGFPTDMQAQFMALASVADGTSHITETVFENRFMHVAEMNRMGARIDADSRTAVVRGVEKLQGAQVMATDLRASASLVIAGLIAEGTTDIRRAYHLDRGYARLEEKLSQLGANIQRTEGDA